MSYLRLLIASNDNADLKWKNHNHPDRFPIVPGASEATMHKHLVQGPNTLPFVELKSTMSQVAHSNNVTTILKDLFCIRVGF